MYEGELYLNQDEIGQSIENVMAANSTMIYGSDFAYPFYKVLNDSIGSLQSDAINEISPIINLVSRNLDIYNGFVDNTLLMARTVIDKISSLDTSLSTQVQNGHQ